MPWEKCTQVGILLFLVLFFAIQVSVQKCWDELKEHCTQIKVGFLVEFLLPAFRQERAQKRVCSEATQEEVAQS